MIARPLRAGCEARSEATARSIAVPSVVPPRSVRCASALLKAARSSVGACSTRTSRANETSPSFAFIGRPAIRSRAAVRAAAIRLGVTSLAAIEFDESTARTTVVSFWSLAISACGRATPTSSSASASSSSAGGT